MRGGGHFATQESRGTHPLQRRKRGGAVLERTLVRGWVIFEDVHALGFSSWSLVAEGRNAHLAQERPLHVSIIEKLIIRAKRPPHRVEIDARGTATLHRRHVSCCGRWQAGRLPASPRRSSFWPPSCLTLHLHPSSPLRSSHSRPNSCRLGPELRRKSETLFSAVGCVPFRLPSRQEGRRGRLLASQPSVGTLPCLGDNGAKSWGEHSAPPQERGKAAVNFFVSSVQLLLSCWFAGHTKQRAGR